MKARILEKLCYTELVYGRINKKLATEMTKKEIESYLAKILGENSTTFEKIGKNWYAKNPPAKLQITINSQTYRVITVDRLP